MWKWDYGVWGRSSRSFRGMVWDGDVTDIVYVWIGERRRPHVHLLRDLGRARCAPAEGRILPEVQSQVSFNLSALSVPFRWFNLNCVFTPYVYRWMPEVPGEYLHAIHLRHAHFESFAQTSFIRTRSRNDFSRNKATTTAVLRPFQAIARKNM